jgi:predicted nucleic acid-binding protein
MNFVLDASVAVKWYVPEIYVNEAVKLLDGDHDFHVPELIFPEISNIIWKKVKREDITQTEGRRIIAALLETNWAVHSHKQTLVSAYAGAEATGQTVYDFTYLALAISLDCEFVTADEKIYRTLENTPFKSNLKWIGDFQEE